MASRAKSTSTRGAPAKAAPAGRRSKTIIHRRFEPHYALISASSKERPYTPRFYEKTAKWSQLHRVLGEIMWLTQAWNRATQPQIVLVVAGAAPGQHYQALSEMFPDIAEIHLYDINAFEVREQTEANPNRIKIFKHPFLESDAQLYAGRSDIAFISDFRNSKVKDERTREEANWRDHQLQMALVEIMNPITALLKFRLPYYRATDTWQPKTVEYLAGRVYTQCFNKASSAETRIQPIRVVDANGRITWPRVTYPVQSYEGKLFHYNTLVRKDWGSHDNTGLPVETVWHNHITGSSGLPDEGDLASNFDSMYLIYILDLYLYFVEGRPDLNRLSREELISYREDRLKEVVVIWNWLRDSLNSLLKQPVSLRAFREVARLAAASGTPERDFGFGEPSEPVAAPVPQPVAASSTSDRIPRTPGKGFFEVD